MLKYDALRKGRSTDMSWQMPLHIGEAHPMRRVLSILASLILAGSLAGCYAYVGAGFGRPYYGYTGGYYGRPHHSYGYGGDYYGGGYGGGY